MCCFPQTQVTRIPHHCYLHIRNAIYEIPYRHWALPKILYWLHFIGVLFYLELCTEQHIIFFLCQKPLVIRNRRTHAKSPLIKQSRQLRTDNKTRFTVRNLECFSSTWRLEWARNKTVFSRNASCELPKESWTLVREGCNNLIINRISLKKCFSIFCLGV
jgi:hypothetical protein